MSDRKINIYFTDGLNPPRVLNISEYTPELIGTPDPPVIEAYILADLLYVYWKDVTYGLYYEVFVNDEKVADKISDLFYLDNEADEGNYKIKVRAYSGANEFSESLTSLFSNMLTFEIIYIPKNLQFASNILSWDALTAEEVEDEYRIEAADGYNVYVDAVKHNDAPVLTNQYDLSDLELGNYDVFVTALYTIEGEQIEYPASEILSVEVVIPAPANLTTQVQETSVEYPTATEDIAVATNNTFASAEGLTHFNWNTVDAEPTFNWNIDETDYGVNYRTATAPNGDVLVGRDSGIVELYDETGTLLWDVTGKGTVIHTAFDPDGNCWLLTRSETETVIKLDRSDGTELDSGGLPDFADTQGFSFTPDGNFVYAAGQVRKVDVSDFSIMWTSVNDYDVNTANLDVDIYGDVYVSDIDINVAAYIIKLEGDTGAVVWETEGTSGTNDCRGRGLSVAENYAYVIRWDIFEEIDLEDGSVVRSVGYSGSSSIVLVTWINTGWVFGFGGGKEVIRLDLSDFSTTNLGNAILTPLHNDGNPRGISSHPGKLAIQDIDPDRYEFDWDAVVDVQGYNLYMDKDGGGYVKQNDTLITGTSYSLYDLVASGEYKVYVVAVRDGGEGEASNIVTFEILPPDTPTGLTATPGDTEVALDWDDSAEEDLAGYNVYVDGSLDAGSPYLDSEATITGLTNDTEYDFQVSTLNDVGNESDLSAVVSATPVAAAVSQWYTAASPGDYSITNTPIPLRLGFSVTFENGDIHVYNYYDGSSYYANVYKYDASAGTWSNHAVTRVETGNFKNPTNCFIRGGEFYQHQIGTSVNGDRIYKLNAANVQSVAYDSGQNGLIAQFGVSFYDETADVLYWGGGLDGASRRRTLYSYNFGTDTLVKFTDFPIESFYGGAIAKVGDYIYGTPGTQTTFVNKAYRIDINNPTGSWEAIADPPYKPNNSDFAWEYEGDLFTASWYDRDTTTWRLHIYKYNVATDTWELWDNAFTSETGYDPADGGGRYYRKSDNTLWLVGGYDRGINSESDKVAVWKQGEKNVI